MHTENNFSYTYSAAENQEALHIRQAYLPQAETNLDELKALDAKVKRPANVFAYVFGSASAVIMGAGQNLWDRSRFFSLFFKRLHLQK